MISTPAPSSLYLPSPVLFLCPSAIVWKIQIFCRIIKKEAGDGAPAALVGEFGLCCAWAIVTFFDNSDIKYLFLVKDPKSAFV